MVERQSTSELITGWAMAPPHFLDQLKWVICLAITIATVLYGHTCFAEVPNKGRFLYSSVCREVESDDTGEYQVRLIRSPTGDSLSLWWSEGVLYGPMRAHDLRIDSKTGNISFVIRGNEPPSYVGSDGRWSGKVSTNSIVLSVYWASIGQPLPQGAVGTRIYGIAPRVQKLWKFGDKMKACK
jgi:hypothetical protein